MQRPNLLRRLRDRSIEPTLILLASTLAMYLGVVYVFAFSQAASSPRQAIHLAILMMDLVIAVHFVRQRPRLRAVPTHGGVNGWLGPAFAIIGYASLLCVVLLHADYALARYRGAEDGVVGSLVDLKSYLLLAQLSYVFFSALSKALAGTPDPALRVPRAGDVLLFSIVLAPLVNYLAHNSELFSFATATEYLAFFLIAPIAAFVLVHVLQQALNAPAIAAPVVAGLGFVHYSMPLVSSSLERPVEALFPVHIGLALIVPGAIAILYRANRRSTTKAVVVLAGCSVAASLIQAPFADHAAARRAAPAAPPEYHGPDPSALSNLLSSPARRRPDVYFLVYDGYAPSAMMRHYGVDDAAGDDYLKRNGFRIYDQAYSLFMSSKPSVASLMDMRSAPQAGIGGDTTVNGFFRRQGYETHLVLNSYLLQGSDPVAADVVFPPWHHRSGLDALYRGIGGGEFKAEVVFQDSERDEWLAAKRTVLQAEGGAPRMLYAHSAFPGHSQNSGNCLADENARYGARLAVAMDEMRRDIDAVLQRQRDAVIIVAGDHGPYLTGDCLYMTRYRPDDLTALHLADRYGAKLAIRWPDKVPGKLDRIAVIQDVFFAVSAYLLEDDRVWLHRIPSETVGYGGIPHGAVKDGIVMVGKDKGWSLLEQ